MKILYVFEQAGCEACAEAIPIVQRWHTHKHLRDFSLVRLNMSFYTWEIGGFSPKKTPTFAFVTGREVLGKREGVLSEKELETFWKTVAHAEAA